MNGKKAKFLRKEARKKLSAEFELLRKVIKPRPKWIPLKVWELGLGIFIHREIVYEPVAIHDPEFGDARGKVEL